MSSRSVYLFVGVSYGLVTTLIAIGVSSSRAGLLTLFIVFILIALLVALYFDHRDSVSAVTPPQTTGGGTPVAPATSLTDDRPPPLQAESYGVDGIATSILEQRRAVHEAEPTPRTKPTPRAARAVQPRAATPPSAASAPAVEWPETLLLVWRDYWQKGDGHFDADGLRSRLVAHGLDADVLEGPRVGANDSVLAIVDSRAAGERIYLLPSFNKPPRAVQDWFDDRSEGGLTGRTQNVIEVAVGRRTERGLEVVKRGSVS